MKINLSMVFRYLSVLYLSFCYDLNQLIFLLLKNLSFHILFTHILRYPHIKGWFHSFLSLPTTGDKLNRRQLKHSPTQIYISQEKNRYTLLLYLLYLDKIARFRPIVYIKPVICSNNSYQEIWFCRNIVWIIYWCEMSNNKAWRKHSIFLNHFSNFCLFQIW